MALVSISSVAACAGKGRFDQATGTGVVLLKSNYKVIKTNASGSSSGFYLLGFIPIVPPNYGKAKKRLYASVGEDLSGRPVALANQTEDKTFLYLILLIIPEDQLIL